MKIEVFYEEIMCLYGDKANMSYLKNCMPEAEFIHTAVNDVPAFVNDDEVSMLYFCSCSESGQLLAIEKLMPYKEKLAAFMESGRIVLAVGNSMEIFGKYIEFNGEKKEALDLIPIYTVNQIPKRDNSLYLGKYGSMDIVGYTSRFSHSYYMDGAEKLFDTVKGYGMNKEDKAEGVRLGGFIGTHLLGPLLIQNPDFTKELLKMLGCENAQLYLEEDLRNAFDIRMGEFRKEIVFFD